MGKKLIIYDATSCCYGKQMVLVEHSDVIPKYLQTQHSRAHKIMQQTTENFSINVFELLQVP